MSDIAPFTHRDGDTQLTIIRKLRAKISEIIAAHNTLNQHLRTAENGLEQKFNTLYTTAAANIDTFEAELEAKFVEAQEGVDTKFDARSAELGTQFTNLAAAQETEFNALKAEQESDFAGLTATFNGGLSALQTQADNAATSASASATSANNAATSASAAATAAQAAQDSAEEAIAVGDNYVANLFNTVGSATRSAITGAMAAMGAWFGTDPDNPNAMITPFGVGAFKDVQTLSLSVAGTKIEDTLNAMPHGNVDWGQYITNKSNVDSTETALLELRTTLKKGRLLDLFVRPFKVNSTVAADVLTFTLRVAYDGAEVSTASTAILSDDITLESANVDKTFRGLISKLNTGAWSADREARFLLTVKRSTGTGYGTVKASATYPVYFEINDLGIAKAAATTGETVLTTRTTVFASSGMYLVGNVVVGSSPYGPYDLVRLSKTSMQFPAIADACHALFNNNAISGEIVSLNTLLSGLTLENIVKVEVYLYSVSGLLDTAEGANGVITNASTGSIKVSTATARSTSIGSAGADFSFTSFPAGKWIDITSAFTLATRSLHIVKSNSAEEQLMPDNRGTDSDKILLKITYNK